MTAVFTPSQLARLLGIAEPTPEQAAVISAPLEPVAVIAGAGSGKSETMAARLVWLVANGYVAPDRVLGLTFTRKAAVELASRVRARLDALHRAGLRAGPPAGAAESGREDPPAAPGEPVIATYHSYAGRLIADHALRDGLEPSLRLITPAVAWQIAARVVAAYDGPMDATEWTPATVTAAVIELAAEIAEHLRRPEDVTTFGRWLAERYAAVPAARRGPATRIVKLHRLREQLLPLVRHFAAAKQAREVIDYGDQMAVAARLALRHPEIGAAERARYRVVLLDEFQDTSHAQLELMRALFGGGHPVTAVGDPCQSIYGWRGASAGNLRRFAATFRPAGSGTAAAARLAATVPLSVSFRNTGAILDIAAALQAGLPGSGQLAPRLIAPPERSGRGQVACALLETSASEAEWVAGQVAGLLRLPPGVAPDGLPWPGGAPDQVRPRDIAVLCRKRAQFAVLRAALEAAGVPVEVVGLGGLLTVPEVADVVATLRVLHDPLASDALARILTSPRWRIGPQDLVALGARARELARAGRDSGRERPAGTGAGPDLLDRAVADFTAEPGSLVEALDDPGEPAAYSGPGFRRLAALAAELRWLRTQAGRPLPELVAETERALGLDIEVASRPGADPLSARADLDAFTDAAAAFAGDAEEPTLGAFLAYLEAAESEEFGLEAGRVGETDTVKLATVHSAKGLQWPAVVVPGLSAGARAASFPARPRVSPGWTENARLLPFPLRGDAADLPALAALDPAAVRAFGQSCDDRSVAEERRLAYVAVTRAAYWLACSGYWWGTGKSPLGPSVFLAEIRAACEAGAGRVDQWSEAPPDDAANPSLAEPLTASWPGPAAGPGDRYQAVREAGDLVRAAMAAAREPVAAAAGGGGQAALELGRGQAARGRDERAAAAPAAGHGVPRPRPDTAAGPETAGPGAAGPGTAGPAAGGAADGPRAGPEVPARYAALVEGWSADTDLLLAERDRRRAPGPVPVLLPRRLPVSALVTLASSPAELAARLRRPMPGPPAPLASRGTAFHRWLEERFGQQRLIDPDELAGAADPDAGSPDADLAQLCARFEAGDWGRRWPAAVEVPFETRIGDRLVRGRIDAVFADSPAGGFDVVDWKTGRPPGSAEEQAAAAVQLAAYRLAWAGIARVPAEQVRAAFYYVRDDLTVRPADLPDETGLERLVAGVPAAPVPPAARAASGQRGDGGVRVIHRDDQLNE